MDVTNASIDDIFYISNLDWFDLLNAKLDICLVDYSIDLFVRSTKCECEIERSLDRNVLTVYEMCHMPACSCEGRFIIPVNTSVVPIQWNLSRIGKIQGSD